MNKAELLKLAERVESATGADRELDAAVYEALGHRLRRAPGYPRARAWCFWDAGRWHSMLPLTADLNAVLALVAEKLPGWGWDLDYVPGNEPLNTAKLWPLTAEGPGNVAPRCDGHTPALALLAVFLRAFECDNG